ncbi:MAG: helicase-related protein, partial [Planctomyces sp.]
SKEERLLAEREFHHGSAACIVCTSTLELGIDVGDLDKVLQSDAPETVGSFLQRMGRTGRREGKAANTTFFCESVEAVLQAIALIELAKSGWVEDVPVNQRCWPVLIHQLLAMSLASNGIPPEEAWAHLSGVPDFRGISRAEFDRLMNWMIEDHSLLLTSGRLVLGPQAERRFGRHNFMELYAVFSSPQSYNVETANRQVIGTLTQDFVDGLVDGVS